MLPAWPFPPSSIYRRRLCGPFAFPLRRELCYTQAMRILAIDPGFGRCGVAIIEKERGGKESLIYSSCIETSSSLPFPQRLDTVARECGRLIAEYAPEAMALEKLYFSNNQKTAMQVAEVRGALLGLAGSSRLPVFEYTPGEIKSAVAGSGSADKKQIARMVHLLVRIEKKIARDDEYDAIALGLTHLARAR